MNATRILFTALILCAFLVGKAQQVNYTVEADDPAKDPVVILNLELMSVDINSRSLDAMALTWGAWGIVEPVPRIGINFKYNRNMVSFGRINFSDYRPGQELNLGGYFVFGKNLKTKPTKVTLDVEQGATTYSTNAAGDRVANREEIETFIMVPAQRYRQYGVRGGLFRKSNAYNVRDAFDIEDLEFPYEYTELTSTGVYAGLFVRRSSNVFINTNTHGRQFNSAMSDIYLDVLLVPRNRITHLDVEEGEDTVDITDDLKEVQSFASLGFRLGYNLYQFEKRTLTGKKFGMATSMEVGYNPYMGWFMNGGLSITLVKTTRPATLN